MSNTTHDGELWEGRLTSSREIRWRRSNEEIHSGTIGDGREAALGWKSVPQDQRISLGAVRWMPWKFPADREFEQAVQKQRTFPPNTNFFKDTIDTMGTSTGRERRTGTSHGIMTCEGRSFSRKFRDDLWQKTAPYDFLNVDDGVRPSLIVFDLDLLIRPRLDELESPPQSWQKEENFVVAGNERIRSTQKLES